MAFKIDNLSINDPRIIFVEAKVAGWAGDIPVDELYDALKEEDIPEDIWPSIPSDNKCLERALHSMKSRRSLVRPLNKSKGFSLILENPEELDLECEESEHRAHKVDLTCKVEKGEDNSPSKVRITPNDHPAVPLIEQEFRRYRGTGEQDGLFKASQDLSVWFSQTVIPWCRAVATRSRGGSYYVLKGAYLDRMQRIVQALDSISKTKESKITLGESQISLPKVISGGRIVLKPEVASTAALEILVDNIIQECDKTCDSLDEKLRDDSLGKRALSTQRKIGEDLQEKLKDYEKVLDMNLSDVKERIQELTSGLGMAELQLQQESYHKHPAGETNGKES